ncbi:very short patch repair endonuclease [Streptomyces mutabilis]|uniref:very short patch repair endonuclease n=1 Tax=Streptomyces mutabilis TaxID=67332 RepID=UPI0022BA39A4|nr:very short patch repair endonuclease [Streptomyces mutabilis]MCZ9354887.1 very short patch repair endonuclease [Streptomyces mutabilis]
MTPATRPAEHAGRWKESLPPERAYKRRAGAAAPAVEQDRAAGGRHRRAVDLGDGRCARASIALKLYRRTRRIRAYLRWSCDGVTRERYVCEVDHLTRGENLAEAWRQARLMGLVTDPPPPEGSTASSQAVRAVMRANRGKDTAPELALRRLLHASGLRYRVDARPVPQVRRRADLVFPGVRVAVFVDGCFWHGCPEHYRPATRNAEFWQEKIEGNRSRDRETNEIFRAAGWSVIRVWEHEAPETAAELVSREVRARRSGSRSSPSLVKGDGR